MLPSKESSRKELSNGIKNLPQLAVEGNYGSVTDTVNVAMSHISSWIEIYFEP